MSAARQIGGFVSLSARHDLLRAHVYRAFDLRGTDEFAGSCRDVVDGWLLFPAIAAQAALEAARDAEDAAIEADERELLEWYASIGMLDEELSRSGQLHEPKRQAA